MSHDVSEIVANPQQYGFAWVEDEVSKGTGPDAVSLGTGPVLVVADPVVFEQHFPGRIVAMLDGSSARVISQRVVRNAREKDRTCKSAELKPRVLQAILGVRAKAAPVVVEKKVYVLPDDTTTTDVAAFKAAWGL